MVIRVTASLKLTPTDLEPILSGFYDGLADDPPVLRVNCRRAGTLVADYHSSSTAPAIGGGDIATFSQAVIGGPNVVKLTLTAGTGPGYLHLRCENDAGASNPLVTQQFTVPSAWHPSELFASNEKGGFWDIKAGTTFPDAYRDTAAVVNDAIGSINDSSGNRNHAQQLTAASRPLLKYPSNIYCLQTDGSDDALTVTLDLDDTDELTIWCLQDQLSVANNITAGLVSASPFMWVAGNTAADASAYTSAQITGGTARNINATASPATDPLFVIGEAKISTSHLKIFVNGQTSVQSSSFGTASNWGTGRQFNISWGTCYARIYAVGIINRLLTAGEITSLQAWAKTRGNITW